ncbi:copper resistance protein CopD, partial [Arthrobacter deserti]|nr:copper resistance protein CopD [Arthrobacter deserti]
MAAPKNTQTSPRPGSSEAAASGWASLGAGGIGRLWLLGGGAVVVLALVAALVFSGAAAARTLSDPGALTRWALPLARSVHNLSAAAVIGALVFAVGILPPRLRPSRRGREDRDGDAAGHPAFTRVLTLAAGAAIAWTLSAVAVLVFSFSDVAGQPLSADPSFTSALVGFMTDISTGRAWLCVTISAAIVATLVFGVRSVTELAGTLVLAVVGGLVPLALIGHSAGGNDHMGAVN